jgi:aspartate/tyrosine/aromatic aminotransferase
LQPDAINYLKKEHGIYMTLDGRMNVAGLNEESVLFLADAIKKL